MPNTHRVLRQFQADGALRNPGEMVDAAEWKNLKALEDQRYVEALDTNSPTLGGPGPTPDPKLIQEAAARDGQSKNSESGGIAAMPEIEGQAAEMQQASDAEAVKTGAENTESTSATKKSTSKKGK